MRFKERLKKLLLYQILVFTIHGKHLKNHTTTMNLKSKME